jgi:hypothetical protein
VAGTVYTAGVVRGGLSRFEVRGRLGVRGLVARGAAVHNGRVEYAWVGARTPASTITAAASLDTVEAAGFALDSVDARVTYRKPGGTVDVVVQQDTGTSYRVKADYALHLDHSEVHLRDLMLRFDTTRWVTARPAAIRWGRRGIDVQTLELRSGAGGRIYANGRIPATGAADLDVQVIRLEVSNVAGLLQSDVPLAGILTLTTRLAGTRARPEIRGAVALLNAGYGGTPIPDLRSTFQYADTALAVHTELLRGTGTPLALMDARIPVNLALTAAPGSRVLDRPMRVDFRADSLPLDALPKFTDAVSDVRGRVIGVIAARGTPRRPSIAGKLGVDFASFRIVPLGVTLREIVGMLHAVGDRIMIDSLLGHSEDGTVAISGSLGIADITRPSFALDITGRNALVLANEQGRLHASADIAVRGPFTKLAITGRAGILSGVIYVPQPSEREMLSASDPAVLQVVDTTLAATRELVPPESPLLKNLRVDVALSVSHDTWVRSPDANVEVYTTDSIAVHVDSGGRALVLEGIVNTDRGDYTYLGRHFVLSRGSATFVGDPEINPLLQVTAIRKIELAGRGALNIQILITGTLQAPKVTLQSDAQPPISQSDLLSYLVFGQSSSSLLQLGGSSGLGGQSTSSGELAGQAAAIATRQMAAVAVDALAKELQMNAARSLGADVLNITPADIPSDFSVSSVETVLAGTQVEVGKYVDQRTFVVLQARPTFVAPGLRVEHRLPKGYRIEASLEPRFLLRQPTLSEQVNPKPTSVLGAFLIREWRF